MIAKSVPALARRYMDSVITPEKYASVPDDLKVIRLALFGIGRAGAIHLKNIVANPRIDLIYIVESDEAKWGECRQRWNLKDQTTFLKPEVRGDFFTADDTAY